MPDVAFITAPGQRSFTLTGDFPAGTGITASWQGVTVNGPCGQYGYACELAVAPVISSVTETRFSISQTTGSISWTTDVAATDIIFNVFTDRFCSGGTLRNLTVNYSVPSLIRCGYGTELKPLGNLAYYLTPALIDTWLVADGMPWLAALFTPLWFTSFNAESICGVGPPPMPAINLSTLDASLNTIHQLLEVIAWPNVCQCKPGTPNPVPYPLPSAPQPAGWPSFPIPTCSPTDLCSILVQIQQQISHLQAAVGEDLGLTTLIQRYTVPFAYIRGARHSGLRNAGSFAVSRLAGIEVEITQTTASHEHLMGNPPYIWDVGWLSASGNDGMLQEKRITRDRFCWFPPQMQMTQLVGWSLGADVTIALTELEAEP